MIGGAETIDPDSIELQGHPLGNKSGKGKKIASRCRARLATRD
jgi:hypothetical protein